MHPAWPHHHALCRRPLMHPEVIAMKQQDAQLARALARSKRVGDMLLKAEEEEAAQIKALGQELLQKYQWVLVWVDWQRQ